MLRFRYSIAGLMTLILYATVGLATIRARDSRIWESATYSLTIVLLASSTLVAFVSKGRGRADWIGFATFGWTYLLLGFHILDAGRPLPLLLTHPLVKELYELARSLYFPSPIRSEAFFCVAHSFFVLLFGLVGAALGHSLAATRPQERGGSDEGQSRGS
jgi:hypothetical protein